MHIRFGDSLIVIWSLFVICLPAGRQDAWNLAFYLSFACLPSGRDFVHLSLPSLPKALALLGLNLDLNLL
ncbi:MAG: hypothetical protein C4540_05815 [Candidatus Omnitrophota bacterium]|nr:MAG: hypothetical protein C4540_05815 [Candidatus Omnitrophota bacterium]